MFFKVILCWNKQLLLNLKSVKKSNFASHLWTAWLQKLTKLTEVNFTKSEREFATKRGHQVLYEYVTPLCGLGRRKSFCPTLCVCIYVSQILCIDFKCWRCNLHSILHDFNGSRYIISYSSVKKFFSSIYIKFLRKN